MSAVKFVTIWCDTIECRNGPRHFISTGETHTDEARAVARAEGWAADGRHSDACPECVDRSTIARRNRSAAGGGRPAPRAESENGDRGATP